MAVRFASEPRSKRNVAGWTIKACDCMRKATGACFQDNQQLIEWVRQQPLTSPLTCLGDGLSGGLESDQADGC